MPEYLSPGVYVEEIDAGPKPIAPVATSTAGALGVTQRGPMTPTLITNYGEFVRRFGGPLPVPDATTQAMWAPSGHFWQAAESIKGFFDEGGARVYFQRVVSSQAVTSTADFDAGLFAGLTRDVAPGDLTIELSHVFGVGTGNLQLVTDAGVGIGSVTVASIDYATRTLTLGAAVPAGINARRGRDLAVITPVAAVPAGPTLTATATSAGAWGNEISVRILPAIGARRTLAATPASLPRQTTTPINATTSAQKPEVHPIPGVLDKNSVAAAPAYIQVNNGPALKVTAMTLAGALTIAGTNPVVNTNDTITVLRRANVGAIVTVLGADRLYPGAIVQLEGAFGAEQLTVVSVAGSQVTLDSTPAIACLEGDSLTIAEADVEIDYRPLAGNPASERFSGLRLTSADPASLVAAVNVQSQLVRLSAGAGFAPSALTAFPSVTAGGRAQLALGDDALGTLTPADFVGADLGPGQRTGIQAWEEIDQIAICIAPGMWDTDIRNALIVHCETLAERFAILDPPPGLSIQQIEAFRGPIDTKYAALYYPWVEIRDPRPGGAAVQAPPSGLIAGVYARTDVARGVHKAPANETLRSIRGFTQAITKREQDILNPQNINVLRAFPGRGNRIWGARVLTSDAAWKYVPVRRLVLMIEESIDEATQWVVFEPNDEALWARVRQSVTNFLVTQWRIGALQGVTADEAFFVACDRSTMTQDDIDNGRLICQVGIAPVKPAEFVIFRIQQKTRETATN